MVAQPTFLLSKNYCCMNFVGLKEIMSLSIDNKVNSGIERQESAQHEIHIASLSPTILGIYFAIIEYLLYSYLIMHACL